MILIEFVTGAYLAVQAKCIIFDVVPDVESGIDFLGLSEGSVAKRTRRSVVMTMAKSLQALEPHFMPRMASNCSFEICTGSLNTVQMTDSRRGGVVSEPS